MRRKIGLPCGRFLAKGGGIQADIASKGGSTAARRPGDTRWAWGKGVYSAKRGDEETVVQLKGTGHWRNTYVNPADDPRIR
jgi:hypothetical protein